MDEIEILREEKNERPDDIEKEIISDTEEQADVSKNLIEVDDVDSDAEDENEPQLPESSTQIRTSGRKRKATEDDLYERY